MPLVREGKTHRAMIGPDTKIYLTTGEYADGRLGEIFLAIDKQGSVLRMYDCFAIMVSLALQHGVPLETLCRKMIGQQMEPAGITDNEQIPIAKSIVEYVFRWLEKEYLKDG